MGLFLSTLIVQNSNENDVRSFLEKAEKNYPEWKLIADECRLQECTGGIKVLLNEMCAGYEDIPLEISRELTTSAMLCYIYDGDYWGYFFYDKGKEADSFNPIPDYFEEISDEEKQRLSGNSKVIAQYFNVDESRIKKYLVLWNDDIFDTDEMPKAYDDDEFGTGEDWQMADFMKAIGYSYCW